MKKIKSVTILLYKYKIIVLEVKQKLFYTLTIKAIQIDNMVPWRKKKDNMVRKKTWYAWYAISLKLRSN